MTLRRWVLSLLVLTLVSSLAHAQGTALERLAAHDAEAARVSEQLEKLTKALVVGRALMVASPGSIDAARLAAGEARKAELTHQVRKLALERAKLLPAARAEAQQQLAALEARFDALTKIKAVGTAVTLLGEQVDPATLIVAEAERQQLRIQIARLRAIAGS